MNNTPGAIVVVGFVDLSQDAAHRLTVRTRRATCSTEWRQVCSSLPANTGCPGKWTSGEFICKCVFDSFNIDNRSVYHNFILVRERQQLSIKPSLIIHPLCVIYKCRDKSRVNASFFNVLESPCVTRAHISLTTLASTFTLTLPVRAAF